MGYVIGIDGGQSGTRCVIGRRDATIAAVGHGSPVDHVRAPGGRARLAQALASAYQAAARSLAPEPIEVAFLAISGVVPPGPEAEIVTELARELWPSAVSHISHDLRAAWAGAFGLRPGIVIVAGSGSAAFGVASDGREARAGGWGYLFGDEGAGWWMAREGIAAALRAVDGTGSATPLTARLLAYFKAESMPAIVAGIYAHPLDRAVVAGASPLVLQSAADGDPVSREIVVRGAHALAGLVNAVRHRLSWDGEVHVAPAGSLWHSTLLHDLFVAALRDLRPTMIVRPAAFPPPVGAFLLALQAAGGPVSLESVRVSYEAVEHVRR